MPGKALLIEINLRLVRRIRDAVLILDQYPLIGHQVEDGHRELVMGRGSQDYLALYRWMPAANTVSVLTVRNEREARYQGGR